MNFQSEGLIIRVSKLTKLTNPTSFVICQPIKTKWINLSVCFAITWATFQR